VRTSIRLGVIAAATIVLSAAIGVRGAVPRQDVPIPKAPGDTGAKMRGHYEQILAIHAAVIRGDLPAVAPSATALIDSLGIASTGPAEPIARIRTAARDAAWAKDLDGASTAAASMLAACGDCHRASRVMPAASLPGLPTVGGVVGTMLEHQRAIEEMLQGLVVPSTSLWREGASAFAAITLHPSDLPVTPGERTQMAGVENRLRHVAEQAIDAPEGQPRITAYATLLAACADCHSRHAKVWGPGRGGGHD